eukprot:TRINITY_DN8583_c0_g1_i2.p1 TRINITY_DN8583_c0_g1~~TRINITY_DN8583_c0_g1_i2.p1  ORF type:complete len:721 (-),score=129.18 TRINITY_DN8583_c0_g1_i2:165-2327(-)
MPSMKMSDAMEMALDDVIKAETAGSSSPKEAPVGSALGVKKGVKRNIRKDKSHNPKSQIEMKLDSSLDDCLELDGNSPPRSKLVRSVKGGKGGGKGGKAGRGGQPAALPKGESSSGADIEQKLDSSLDDVIKQGVQAEKEWEAPQVRSNSARVVSRASYFPARTPVRGVRPGIRAGKGGSVGVQVRRTLGVMPRVMSNPASRIWPGAGGMRYLQRGVVNNPRSAGTGYLNKGKMMREVAMQPMRQPPLRAPIVKGRFASSVASSLKGAGKGGKSGKGGKNPAGSSPAYGQENQRVVKLEPKRNSWSASDSSWGKAAYHQKQEERSDMGSSTWSKGSYDKNSWLWEPAGNQKGMSADKWTTKSKDWSPWEKSSSKSDEHTRGWSATGSGAGETWKGGSKINYWDTDQGHRRNIGESESSFKYDPSIGGPKKNIWSSRSDGVSGGGKDTRPSRRESGNLMNYKDSWKNSSSYMDLPAKSLSKKESWKSRDSYRDDSSPERIPPTGSKRSESWDVDGSDKWIAERKQSSSWGSEGGHRLRDGWEEKVSRPSAREEREEPRARENRVREDRVREERVSREERPRSSRVESNNMPGTSSRKRESQVAYDMVKPEHHEKSASRRDGEGVAETKRSRQQSGTGSGSKQARPNPKPLSVKVSNVPRDLKEADVRDAFATECGTVTYCRLSRGVAWISFENPEDAVHAVETFHLGEINDTKIIVELQDN